ncbi:MAG: 2-oxoglutarate dehydrogenase complex dihydrolipoyllysine-residue succinyltransferase [Alphaproteobacteria bacterium]
MATKILVPSLGESVSEGIVASWLKKPGDVVSVDEVVMELETDKVTIEVLAPEAGTLAGHEVAEGDTVEPGGVLGLIESGEGDKPKEDSKNLPKDLGADAKSHAGKTLSPAVQKLAAENTQINPETLNGTGKDGRVTKGDMLLASQGAAAEQKPASDAVPASVADQITADREKRVRMTGLRRTIAKRLKEAQNTAAILTTYNEADMTAIKGLRAQHQEAFVAKYGAKLGFMSFFVAACCQALRDIPAVNAEIDGDEIIYKNYYNVGVAVGTPTGLVVPVIKDADQLGFADIEKTIVGYGKRARDGKLTMSEMTGGTFTISNGGTYGSLMSAPILNPPQSGILGMHKIQDRPVAVNGQIEIRPMMYLALSYDHRIIDGKEAVTFLVKVKDALENPEKLMLGL